MNISNVCIPTPADLAKWPLHDAATARALFDALQAQLLARGLDLRAPPPEPTTCCGRGCNGCVWEGFVAAAQYWRDEALLVLGV